MIPAILLCTHLAAAHAVTHCREGVGPDAAAVFDTDGGRGLVWQSTPSEWDSLTKPDGTTPRERAMSKAGEAKLQSLLAKPGLTIIDSHAARIIVAFNGPVPEKARWWIQSIQFQQDAIDQKHRAEAEIKAEKANAAGVVDLSFLHEQGYLLSEANEKIVANGAEYRKTTGLAIPVTP